MSYCINPLCPQPGDLANAENRLCHHCGSALVLRDRYRIVKLLSDDSGFATIYEVSDATTTQILKVLKFHHNKNLRAVELFRQEAIILSQLRHPGIPNVEPDAYFAYTSHNNPELIHCFVMEKIEGMNLQQWLQQQTQNISQTQALLWLQQLTKILQIVHKHNYFHRDIKLQNIMLRPSGQLVLIDFGAAREMTYTYLAQIGSAGTITRISSAGYTPPEQEKGHAVPQSDFYALGRTFVYLLTGKKLSDIYNPLTDEFDWRDYAPQITIAFADFIDRLMSAKAIDRPKDTQEMLAILDRLLAGNSELPADYRPYNRDEETVIMSKTTVLQKDESKQYSAKKWLIGGGLAVLLLASGGYWAWYKVQLNSQTVVTQSWESDRVFEGHSSNINNVAITADQKVLISASADKTIKIWDLETGRELKTLTGHESYIN
ncbi:MAG: serine/threonine-protein kinase, partial [Jaaginema sp. PMC 1079.18]|nr:serine/threonine-protein kinase [Jaaginema sp. PMC 1079.18]